MAATSRSFSIRFLLEIKMPYQVMNLCESTQIAMNVFHMFRNGTVNQFYSDDGLDTYIAERWDSKKECMILPDQDPVKSMMYILQGGYNKIRVHDIVKSGEWYERDQRRLVQFMLDDDRGDKIIFSVVIQCQYLDGDEVSGWSGWSMHSAEIRVCRRARMSGSEMERKGGTDVFRFGKLSFDRRGILTSVQMRQNLGYSFVYLMEEETEEVAEAA